MTLAIEARLQLARDNGTKIVSVTHDLGQARRLAEHLVFVHRGRRGGSGLGEDVLQPTGYRLRPGLPGWPHRLVSGNSEEHRS